MNSRKPPILAIVVPCYNEQEALRASLDTLAGVLAALVQGGRAAMQSYIFCVDDGSTDATAEVICRAAADGLPVRGHRLGRNTGHQGALLSGLDAVRGRCDAAISIDADLQDDPEAIPEMVDAYLGGAEIVYGVRRSRSVDNLGKRGSARAYYRLQRAMGLDVVSDHADFRLLSARALDALAEYGERNLYLRGIIPQLGLNNATVYYDRRPRLAGRTKYTPAKMTALAIDGVTSFTSKPLRLIFCLGVVLLVLDVLVGIYVLVSYFTGHYAPGWSSLMLSLWFLGSILLIGLGVVGEYVGKIFVEVKRRPRYPTPEVIETPDK